MNRWEKIVRNEWLSIIVKKCYTQFPVQVRATLSSWIEEREELIYGFDSLNPQHSTRILEFLGGMVNCFQEVCRRLQVPPNDSSDSSPQKIVKNAYLQTLATLQQNVANIAYFEVIKDALIKERELLKKLEASSVGRSVVASEENFLKIKAEIQTELDFFLRDGLPTLEAHLKTIDSEFKEFIKIVDAGQFAKNKQELSQNVQQLYREACLLKSKLDYLFDKVTQELTRFKDEQRLNSLGKKPVRDLDTIDDWWGSLAQCLASLAESQKLLCFLSHHLCPDLYVKNQALQEQIEDKTKELIHASLVIEVQPKPVVRLETCFFGHPVKLRVLRFNRDICIKSVDQHLLYQQGVEKALRKDFKKPEKGDVAGIVDSKKTIPPTIDSSSRTVEYKDLQVKKVNRTIKRSASRSGSVMEEQFYVLFQVELIGDVIDYKLSAVSLRLCVTTNPSQEQNAWASIIWENCLEIMKSQGYFFSVDWLLQPASSSPPTTKYKDVSWTSLIESINYIFGALGRELSARNKNYLRNKIFKGDGSHCNRVSWTMFAQDPLLEVVTSFLGQKKEKRSKKSLERTKEFTFWEWVYSCLEMLGWTGEDRRKINHSVRKLWQKGNIEGFMSEEDIRTSLSSKERRAGNFILSFPAGLPTTIGINVLDGRNNLLTLAYTKYDLEKLSLEDRIATNSLLIYLYPDKKKEEEFAPSPSQHVIVNGCIIKIGLMENLTGIIEGGNSHADLDLSSSPGGGNHSESTLSASSPSVDIRGNDNEEMDYIDGQAV